MALRMALSHKPANGPADSPASRKPVCANIAADGARDAEN
jgi:hypothetical protein